MKGKHFKTAKIHPNTINLQYVFTDYQTYDHLQIAYPNAPFFVSGSSN